MIIESQNISICKGPTRITESNPWLHTGPPNIQTTCLDAELYCLQLPTSSGKVLHPACGLGNGLQWDENRQEESLLVIDTPHLLILTIPLQIRFVLPYESCCYRHSDVAELLSKGCFLIIIIFNQS